MSRQRKSQKPENRPSLSELSALLDEDNSDDGQRLAEYLLKKQGTQRPMRVFGEFQPKRYSAFKIRLQKVETSEDIEQVAQSEPEKEVEEKTQTEKQDVDTEKSIPLADEEEKQKEKEFQENIAAAVGLAKNVSKPSRINPATRKSPLPPLKSPQFGALRSSLRKSGGMPSADRLRRYSFKRQSAHNSSGRRRLLQEFDSIAAESDFSPNCYSTPVTQNPSSVPISPKTPTKPSGAASPVHNDENSNVPACPLNEAVSSDVNIEELLTSLHKQDVALREMLEKDMVTTNQNIEERNISPINSSMRYRTYNIEKGTQPGQAILTPTKTHTSDVPHTTPKSQQQQKAGSTDQYPRPECPIEKPSTGSDKPILASPKVLEILQRITGKNLQRTTRSMSTEKPEILSCIPLRTPSRIPLRSPSSKIVPMPEIPNTPDVAEQHEHNNTHAYDVEIPETQELHHSGPKLPNLSGRPPTTNELLQSLQGTTSPMVVVPIYQTFNQLPQTELNLEVGTENVCRMTVSAGKQTAKEITLSKAKVTAATSDHRTADKTNNQTFNKSTNKTLNKTTSKTLSKSSAANSQSHKHIDTPHKTAALIRLKNNMADYVDVDDNLRFEDIITEDEDDEPRSSKIAEKSPRNALQVTNLECRSAPLNLAPPAETCVPRRTRKRVARQLIATDSAEMETEMWPPRAHPLTVSARTRAHQHRRNVPLNAEPRTPINGEKFATELKTNLARLKNHEILDLRTRNSIGKVVTISGRKSLVYKKDTLEKQLQLENEIQFELLRRNLEGNDNSLTPLAQKEDQNPGAYDMFELPPAPDGFRDRTTQFIDNDNVHQEQEQHQQEEAEKMGFPVLSSPYNSSLIDDRSCDRISLVRPVSRKTSRANKKVSRRRRKCNMTEEVQKYLDVSKRITKHKLGDKSKRSLYSQSNESSLPSPTQRSQRFSADVATNDPPFHLRVQTPSQTRSPFHNKSRSRSSKSFKSSENLPLPPPTAFSDSDTNNGDIEVVESENNIFKKPKPPRKQKQKLTNKKDKNFKSCELHPLPPPKAFSDSDSNNGDIQVVENENNISKKPLPPPPLLKEKQKLTNKKDKSFKSCELHPLPPPKPFSDSHSNNGDIQVVENENNIFKKPLPPPPLLKQKQKLTNKKHKTVVAENILGLEAISDTADDSHIFKKPRLPPPKKASKKKSTDKKHKAPIEEEQQVVHEETAEPNNESTTLRRSKRGHMPLKNYWSFRSTDPMPPYDFAILEKRKEEAKRRRELRKNNTAASIRSDGEYMPIASSTAIKTIQNTRGRPRKINAIANALLGETNVTSASSECSTSSPPKRKRLTIISEPEEFDNQPSQENELYTIDVAQPNNELPHSTADKNHIAIEPVDVEKLNIIFDQLKNATLIDDNADLPSSSSSLQTNENVTKNLRVRLQRIEPSKEKIATENIPNKKQAISKKKSISTKKYKELTAAAKISSDTVPVSVPEQQTVDSIAPNPLITRNPNDSEVLSWLRNISFANSKPGKKNENTFEEMRCSNTGNLVLSSLEGLEYAYYDNDPDANISYLRFKPHQSKPAKRAKKFQLQFLVLSGKFVFSTNRDLATFNPGALITIDIGARYSIKNVTDKQALLMVLKKANSET